MAMPETVTAVSREMTPHLRVVRGGCSMSETEELVMGAVWDSGREGYELSAEQAAFYGLISAGSVYRDEELNADLRGIRGLVTKQYVTQDAKNGRLRFTEAGMQRASQIVLSNMYHVSPTAD